MAEFRRARREDIPGLVAIQDEGELFWNAGRFHSELQNPLAHNFVALSEKSLVGFIGAWVVGDTAEVHNIFVARGHRRCGIATELLACVVTLARTKRVGRLLLEVAACNQSARMLYNSLCFREVGIRSHYYKNGEAILMEREL